jgi:hypothetical protein
MTDVAAEGYASASAEFKTQATAAAQSGEIDAEATARAVVVAGAAATGTAACIATGAGAAISPLCGLVAGAVADWAMDNIVGPIGDFFSCIFGCDDPPDPAKICEGINLATGNVGCPNKWDIDWDVAYGRYYASSYLHGLMGLYSSLRLGSPDAYSTSIIMRRLHERGVFAPRPDLASSYGWENVPYPFPQGGAPACAAEAKRTIETELAGGYCPYQTAHAMSPPQAIPPNQVYLNPNPNSYYRDFYRSRGHDHPSAGDFRAFQVNYIEPWIAELKREVLQEAIYLATLATAAEAERVVRTQLMELQALSPQEQETLRQMQALSQLTPQELEQLKQLADLTPEEQEALRRLNAEQLAKLQKLTPEQREQLMQIAALPPEEQDALRRRASIQRAVPWVVGAAILGGGYWYFRKRRR